MKFHLDSENISLAELRKRIEETDLVPSRVLLLNKIEMNFKLLEQQGFKSLEGIRKDLNNSKRLETLSAKTGIDFQYLTILRREIGSYFPKPIALDKFDWLDKGEVAKLQQFGIRNNIELFEATNNPESLSKLAGSAGVNQPFLENFARIADLTRIQWVSPLAARMLFDAGFDSTEKVAAADSYVLYEALVSINEGNRYFKGKLGLRDVKRLIKSAEYVMKWTAHEPARNRKPNNLNYERPDFGLGCSLTQ